MYFFGGKDSNNIAHDKLWLLKVYQSPAEFVPLEPQGKKPVGRYGHSLHHIENTPYLVLFAGRNDHFFKIFTYKTCFAFLDLLDVEKCYWLKVSLGTYKPQSRFNFCSAIHGSRLLIFGGLTDWNYIPSQMERLEFDGEKVDQIIKLEQKSKNSSKRYQISIDPDVEANQAPKQNDNESKTADASFHLNPQAYLQSSKQNIRPGSNLRYNQANGEESSNSLSQQGALSLNRLSYQPIPKSQEQRIRHLYGTSFSFKPK